MKRSPLKRKTAIRRVSTKQKKELALRSKLKAELIAEYGGRCMTCGGKGDWRGISLSHIIALGQGGKTTRENCILECGNCHSTYEKHAERRPEWQKSQYNIRLDKGYTSV